MGQLQHRAKVAAITKTTHLIVNTSEIGGYFIGSKLNYTTCIFIFTIYNNDVAMKQPVSFKLYHLMFCLTI